MDSGFSSVSASDRAARGNRESRAVLAARPTSAPPSELAGLYFAIEASRTGDRPLIVQFMGVAGGEGVSTIAAAYARQSTRTPQASTLVVVCGSDTGSPAGGLHPLPSLLDLFQAGRPLQGALAPLAPDRIKRPHDAVRWAALGQSAEQELDLGTLAELAETLRQTFGMIVLDCPPVTHSPLSGMLSRIADGTVVVTAAGATRRRPLQQTITEVERMGGHVVGLVLNRQRDWLPAWLRRQLG